MELIKSKGMILFVVLIAGVTYISSINNVKLEKNNLEDSKQHLAINI